jgi:hypothetical protein
MAAKCLQARANPLGSDEMNRKQAILALLRGAIPFSLLRLAQAEEPLGVSPLQHRTQQPSNIQELENKVADLMQRVSALEQSKSNIVGFTKSGQDLVLECTNLEIRASRGASIRANTDVKQSAKSTPSTLIEMLHPSKILTGMFCIVLAWRVSDKATRLSS